MWSSASKVIKEGKLKPNEEFYDEEHDKALKVRQSRIETKSSRMSKQASHFLVAPETLDKVSRKIVAPYAQIQRRDRKDAPKEGKYIDINRFQVFLKDEVDLNSLLYETSNVLKSITNSSGVFVYTVNPDETEIILMPYYMQNSQRHEVNFRICEGHTPAAHVAATKEYLIIDDMPRDTRFTENMSWCDAKTALCMPVVEPDGHCYAVLELYRTVPVPYDHVALYSVLCCAGWAGAAVHQTQQRTTLQKRAHLDAELLLLLQQYFCDLVSLETMITEMLTVAKQSMGAMRSSFYILDKENMGDDIMAEMWDDGFSDTQKEIPKKKLKVNLSKEQSVAGLVARTGEPIRVANVYTDTRFVKEVESLTGAVTRSVMCHPIKDKYGVIGVVQVVNKTKQIPFNDHDESIFKVFVGYCSLIVHFANMQFKMVHAQNLNHVYADLLSLHLHPCVHDMAMLTGGYSFQVPNNFKSIDFYMDDLNKSEAPNLLCYMFKEILGELFDHGILSDFILTILQCYRPNPYHNAEHAFVFTHTMYVILSTEGEYFSFVEKAGLMIGGFCHDLDHPGVNNNFLALCKHPLSLMYRNSTLENHHFFLAKNIIESKGLLNSLRPEIRAEILEEIRYNILCTDLANYFRIRAQLAPIIAETMFDFTNKEHKNMLKGILMTTCDLSGMSKPFKVAKSIAEKVYEEFYNQGDSERDMNYIPLSMMDRRRSSNQPAEQIQFLAIVVLPCMVLLQSIFPSTHKLTENCKLTQESWHEEIEMRGQKLWKQDTSIVAQK